MKVVLLELLLTCAVWGSPRLDPLVDTKVGLIRGLQASDGDYSMFLGIPYARVNESNPFGPSLPYPRFEDVFEAYDDTAICPQKEEFHQQIVGSLDCLHLNIYVPNQATPRNKLPVIVWIYGGGFEVGFAGRYLYGARYLVRHDVILVTVNYRLGPYGFMCLDTPEVPGNQGLKDQLSALRWVRENIDAFGGDADKVTLVGLSAGGMSVDLHLVSEQEKLFDKLIIQGGTARCLWSIERPDRNAPMKIAEHLGLKAESNVEAATLLAKLGPKLVIAATRELSIMFLPCVEKDFDGVEKFVTEYPRTIPKAKNTPILTGYTNQEALYIYGAEAPDNHVGTDVFKKNMALAFDLGDDVTLTKIVRQFYIGDEEITEDVKWKLMDFESDFVFYNPIGRSLQNYLENAAKVYHYMFSYTGARNFMKIKNNITVGDAAHADELGYLFDVSYLSKTPAKEDRLVIDRMTMMWTNFAKYGDPTPETSDLLPVKWTPVTEDALNYLEIDKEVALKRKPFHARMAFWDLIYRINKNLVKEYK